MGRLARPGSAARPDELAGSPDGRHQGVRILRAPDGELHHGAHRVFGLLRNLEHSPGSTNTVAVPSTPVNAGWKAGRIIAPAMRRAAEHLAELVTSLRVRTVYTDLDGTLLGPGGSLFATPAGPNREPAEAVAALLEASIDLVVVS